MGFDLFEFGQKDSWSRQSPPVTLLMVPQFFWPYRALADRMGTVHVKIIIVARATIAQTLAEFDFTAAHLQCTR